MNRNGRTRRRFLAVLGSAVAGGLAGCTSSPNGDPTGATTTNGSPASTGSASAQPNPYTRVYHQTIDSVVLVRVFTEFGTTSQGSGFVYAPGKGDGDGDDDGDRNGQIVTNQHVVDAAEHIEIRFANGDWRDGTIRGTDVYTDLGVLSVPDRPDPATPLTLVSEDPPIGTEVIALGNPFGLGESVSAGIVSGVDRSLPGPNDFSIPDAIQTDAAVNPGNSGGPLVTLDGRVVGVINSGGGDNIGFAISAAMVRRVIPALVEAGHYDHPYMGVRLLTVTPTVADANDIDVAAGVLVVSVLDGSPSDGVLEGSPSETVVHNRQVPVGGDVIRKMGGVGIDALQDLSNFLALETRPGDEVPIEVIRDGSRKTLELTLGTRPDP